MAKNAFILILTLLGMWACGSAGSGVPSMSEGLLNMGDTLTLGLPRLERAETIFVTPARGQRYVNNVLLTAFRGRYYCMWQESARDEDTPDTHVMYATSPDGRRWSMPELLAGPTDSTFVSPGGWIQRGDSLSAVLNYTNAADRSQGGTAWYISSADGLSWTERRPLLMADGTPLDGILEQDPLLLPNGRTVGAAHLRPGTKVCPIYTDDPSALRGWKKAAFPEGEGKPLEPSQYCTKEGELIMFFRDQASSFRKLYSVSTDLGAHWSAPALTNIPDSRSKQCAGTLPDGHTFWVGNPTGNKSRRNLVIALSEDGFRYDKAWLLAGPEDLPQQRFPGRYKTLGFSYPKATIIGQDLWVSFSVDKEDAVLIRTKVLSLHKAL